MNAQSIIENIKKQKTRIKVDYKAKIIGLFGSFSRNEQKANSDIDLLVEFDKDADLINYVGLSDYLELVLCQKVDLVSRSFLRKEIKPFVMKDLKEI
jgi:hypothetical protein